jgi:hypothetical protein
MSDFMACSGAATALLALVFRESRGVYTADGSMKQAAPIARLSSTAGYAISPKLSRIRLNRLPIREFAKR